MITYLRRRGFYWYFGQKKLAQMHHSAFATGMLLIAIMFGASISGILFQRETWCRHLCPMGAMIGTCAMTGSLELRSNPDICLNKCNTFSCYKGHEGSEGCPLFQHVPFIDNNQVCKLCMKCVRSCPNGSVQLNLRLPGHEIMSTQRVNRGLVVFMTVLLTVVANLAIFDVLYETMPLTTWRALFTASYWGTGLLAGLLVWLAVRNRFLAEEALPMFRKLFAFIPLLLSFLSIYQAKFLPVLPFLHVEMSTFNAKKTILFNVPMLSFFSWIIFLCGLGISLTLFWRVSRATE